MNPTLTYATVFDRPRQIIHVVRVVDEILDLPEIDSIAETMRARILSRYGEQTPNVVVVQGDSKETLRLFGEPYAATRVRAAVFHVAITAMG